MRQEHSDDKKEGATHLAPTSPYSYIIMYGCLGIPFARVINPLKKPQKKMKKINWKAVINFIITVLTAIASSFFVSSCK